MADDSIIEPAGAAGSAATATLGSGNDAADAEADAMAAALTQLVGNGCATEQELEPAIELAARIASRGERNPNVPMGLSGADTLGLRQTENASAVSRRGQGTKEERVERLGETLGVKSMGASVAIDDSWEDETGFVRSKARLFEHRGRRHDPTEPPPGATPFSPKLPLVYNLKGEPAVPSPPVGASEAELEAFTAAKIAELRDPESGKYKISVSLSHALRSLEALPWPDDKPFPPQAKSVVDAVLCDRTNSSFSPAPGAVNHAGRAVKVHTDIVSGDYRFLRVTNLGDFEAFPRAHVSISWAEILGEHCSSFFCPQEGLRVPRLLPPSGEAGGNGGEGGGDYDGAPGGSAGVDTAKVDRDVDNDDTADGGGGGADGDGGSESAEFKISFLEGATVGDDGEDGEGAGAQGDAGDLIDYCCNLMRDRFAQFEEYLDRPSEQRQCCVCKGPGADCLFLGIGDEQISGVEWLDPVCSCMACRACATTTMAKCDLCQKLTQQVQRCWGCFENAGGFQVHNAATKKLLLMQAATQVMLFCGPRAPGEAPETFEENTLRRACVKTVIEVGFERAVAVEVGSNRALEVRAPVQEFMSGGWVAWAAPKGDGASTGYDAASLQGRLLLRMCEAEAQLDNYARAEGHATRAAELLSTLDRGRIGTAAQSGQRSHPARQLIIPARQIAKKMAALARAAAGGGASAQESGGGGGKGKAKPSAKKKGKKKGKK